MLFCSDLVFMLCYGGMMFVFLSDHVTFNLISLERYQFRMNWFVQCTIIFFLTKKEGPPLNTSSIAMRVYCLMSVYKMFVSLLALKDSRLLCKALCFYEVWIDIFTPTKNTW